MASVTPKLNIARLVTGQTNGEITVNEALNVIDALMHLTIEDRDLTAPPVGVDGAAYIVGSNPTGAWTGQAGKIAFYFSGWLFLTPKEGMRAWVKDEDSFLVYDGSAWTYDLSRPKDLSKYFHLTGGSNDRYYAAGQAAGSVAAMGGSMAPSANQFFAIPFMVGQPRTIDRLGVYVTVGGAAGARMRVGVYTNVSDADPYPGECVIDAGELNVETTAQAEFASISQAIVPNRLYWAVLLGNGNGALIRTITSTYVPAILGFDNTLSSAPAVGWVKSGTTYGALPATFPAAADFLSAVTIPGIFMRFA